MGEYPMWPFHWTLWILFNPHHVGGDSVLLQPYMGRIENIMLTITTNAQNAFPDCILPASKGVVDRKRFPAFLKAMGLSVNDPFTEIPHGVVFHHDGVVITSQHCPVSHYKTRRCHNLLLQGTFVWFVLVEAGVLPIPPNRAAWDELVAAWPRVNRG
jgi:hypothetical protein